MTRNFPKRDGKLQRHLTSPVGIPMPSTQWASIWGAFIRPQRAGLPGCRAWSLPRSSACTSASLEPSYVLRALVLEAEMAHTSLRFGLGRFTTEADIDYAIDHIIEAVSHLRAMSPLWDMHQEGIDIKSIQWADH